MILHIDMDAFFASIEQAINPRLKGKPLIVGSRENKLYTVVCAASYEAKALGIDSGMSSKEALKICPNLKFVPAEQGKYIWTSEQIFALLKEYGFALVYASIDEFQMDIQDHPEPLSLARDIQQSIQEDFKITASIGIAKNWLLAKLASKLNKPNGIAILTPENLEPTLAKIPVEKLCGIGPSLTRVLANLGIKTCLDLYQKSAPFLEQQLGQNGLNLYLSLHSSEGFSSQETPEKPKSVGHSYTLPRASANPRFIQAWLRLLSEMVSQRLREQNLVAKTVHLWLDSPKIGFFGAQQTFQTATDDGYEVYQRTLKIGAKIRQNQPKIRAMGVTCSGLFRGQDLSLFKAQKRREALLKTLDKINQRFGENTIFPAIITFTRKMPTN